jgi:hypothetical protein
MEIPSIVRFILSSFKIFGIGKNLDVWSIGTVQYYWLKRN